MQGHNSRSLMLHGICFVTGDPSIRITYPFVFHPGVRVTVSEPGPAKWIYMPIPLCKGDVITKVSITYKNSDMMSHVSMIRIVEQYEPISATVLHNEVLDENTTGIMTNFTCKCNIKIQNSTILKLCMDFLSSDDMIEFGAVEITYLSNYPNIKTNKRIKNSRSARGRLSKIADSLSIKF